MSEFKVTLRNAPDCTLDDYIHDIKVVWKKHDPGRSMYDMWLHTVNHGSKLGEGVRRGRFDKVLDELSDVIMWFLTFLGRLQESPGARSTKALHEELFYAGGSLTEIVLKKYPNLCPVCFLRLYNGSNADEWWGKKCECLMKLSEVETRNEMQEAAEAGDKDKEEKVKELDQYAADHKDKMFKTFATVSQLQSMFEQVFQANIEIHSLESITFHLLEEIGEVSDALLRIYTYKGRIVPSASLYGHRILNLENELADVVSWIFAVSLKVKRLYVTYDRLREARYPQPMQPKEAGIAEQINFWEILLRRYGHPDGKSLWCPHCRERYCDCELTLIAEPSQIMR